MRKIICILTAVAACMLIFSSVMASEELVNDILMPIDDSVKDETYYQDAYEACVYNSKVAKNYPFTFEEESYSAYKKAVNKAIKVDPQTMDDDAKALIDSAVEAQKNLIQVEPTDAHRIYVWGDDMPLTQEVDAYVFDFDAWDNADFRPFLVPYILEDQSECKGNIILVSGGGFTHRANESEGYVIAPLFNDLGYNVFVLQRRVFPYEPKEIYMDLQRSIRLVRHNIDDWGLGSDYMIINGYSGGGGTVMGVIQNLYGDIKPTIWAENYVCDEIDSEDSDVNAAFIIYGAGIPDESEEESAQESVEFKLDNPNLPALFIAVGGDDSETLYNGSIRLAQEANNLTLVDLHVFGNTGHGFGKGLPKSNSGFWMEMADNFVEIDKAISK